jgi:hypothetical protein
MAFRQPRISSAADAYRDVTDHALKLALATIGDKKTEEANRVNLAIKRLNSLESRRNTIEVAWLEKQAQIAGYIGESDSLQDIYKTGGEGKLGSSIEDITFDLYDEPYKYHKQVAEITQNQIDVLGPAMISSIDMLAKLSQAQDFITKGIGATFKTGVTEKEIGEWGPEDLSQAAFRGKFYPELEKGKKIPRELEVFFQRHKPDPINIAGLEAGRLKSAWDIEQRGITRGREEREKELYLYTTGVKKLPVTEQDKEANKSLRRLNIYNPMITKAQTGMMFAGMGYGKWASGAASGKEADFIQGQNEFDAEAFRIGLIFNPATAVDVGIDQSKIREMSAIEFQDRYQELSKKKPNDPKRIEAMQIRQLGVEIFHLNDPKLKSDPLDVKNRGVIVPPYNDRDELIARAYRRFRDIKAGVSDTAASTYADGIEYILGVNLKEEGTVRGILKEYFRENYLASTIGHEYDTISTANITPYQSRLAGNFMNLVKESYRYDIIEDKWIEGWKELADGTMEPIYE